MIKRIIDKETNLFIRDDFTFDEETEIGLDLTDEQMEQMNSKQIFIKKWNFETQQFEESATQEYIDSLKQPLVEEVPLDVRVAKIEQEQEAIVDVLAEMLGV